MLSLIVRLVRRTLNARRWLPKLIAAACKDQVALLVLPYRVGAFVILCAVSTESGTIQFKCSMWFLYLHTMPRSVTYVHVGTIVYTVHD